MSEYVDLDADTAGLLEALRLVRERITTLGETKVQLEERIKAVLGEAPEARIDGRPVLRWAWTRPVRALDTSRLKREAPEVYAQFARERPGVRRFVLLDPEDQA